MLRINNKLFNYYLIIVGLILFSSCSEDDDSNKLTIDNEGNKDTLKLSSESFVGRWKIIKDTRQVKYEDDEEVRIIENQDYIGDTLQFDSNKNAYWYLKEYSRDLWSYQTDRSSNWYFYSTIKYFSVFIDLDMRRLDNKGYVQKFFHLDGNVLEYSPYLIVYNDDSRDLPENTVSIKFVLEKIE